MTMMNRPSPSPSHPASSSSDDEEQLENLVVKENIKDEEAEEEEEEEEDDESIFTVKKHADISQPQSSSSSSSMCEEEEEEESNSKSARSDYDLPVLPPPPPPPENTTNNITDVDPSVKKPIPMFPSSAKRVLLYEAADNNKPVEGEVSNKRKKNGGVDDGEVSEMILSPNKLWSKTDEVVILKGLLSLIKKYGAAAKPTSELMNELHENIKDLIQAQVTNDQLYSKIRKLKQNYSKGTINDFELANRIWGISEKEMSTDEQAINGGGMDSAAQERKNTTRSRLRSSKASKTVVSPQQQQQQQQQQQLPLPSFNEIIESGKNSIAPPPGLKRFLAKEALGFIQGSKAKDLEEKWQIAEAKIYLDRIDLVKEQVELLLDAFGTEGCCP